MYADDPLNVEEIDPQSLIPDKPAKHRPTRAERRGELTNKNELKVKFDFEGAYPSIPGQRPLGVRREKRTGCMGGLLFAVFILVVSSVLAVVLWLGATDLFAFGKTARTVTVVIPRDFDMDRVTDILYENELIRYKPLFKIYLGFSSGAEKIAPGTYVLDAQYDYRALVNGMTKKGAVRVTKDLTFPEGFTANDIFTRLESEGICYADDLWEMSSSFEFDYDFLDTAPKIGDKLRLEGFLFPDTYTFYVNDDPERVIKKFLDNFSKRFTPVMQETTRTSGFTLHEILTIASMIEREAGTDTDRPLISSVIRNRLKQGQKLELDATIYYALWVEGLPSSSFTTSLDNPYNTYRAPALPPGPISSPGLKSINAALNPAATDYFYYALSKDGSHRFFKTFAEQQEFVRSDEYARN